MWWSIAKVLISGSMIVFSGYLAGKKPVLAGFIIALPLMSMLSIVFSYVQYKDMEKINVFAQSIFVAVPLSLLFFVPFFLNKWLKLGFAQTYCFALMLLLAGYLLHHVIFGKAVIE